MPESHQAKKRFGQNFLIDHNVIGKICDAIQTNQDDDYLEIGPGLGALTSHIINKVKHLSVIEIDRDAVEILQSQFAESNNLTIISQDVLKVDFSALFHKNKQLHVFGNLPYNISTPILFHCLKHAPLIKNMVFMLQKEVVDRMVAEPNSKQYGRLSIMLAYHCNVRRLFNVSKNSFQPAPKVMSSIVELTPHDEIVVPAQDYNHFELVVREAFIHRRKTLQNALKKVIPAQSFDYSGIDPSLRAEVLTTSDFVNLSNAALAL